MADSGLAGYEAEQKKLRDQAGVGEEEDFELNLSVPEVNPTIYKDVEPLLFRGFLTLPVTFNGVTFVFKSLNHHEFGRISLSYPVTQTHQEVQRYYDVFLAYGVLLVGGRNVLLDRDSSVEELSEFFAGLDRETKKTVIRHLSALNRRATRAVILTEAYTIESVSRLRWAQTRSLDLSSPAISGFAGTNMLGLNWAQLTWRAINHFEDQREQAEREWENTKFVASSMAGKGMNKIYSQDKRRRQSERDSRVERRDKLIRHVYLNEPMEGPLSGPIQAARTLEELQAQLERDLKGEQDWHDQVISAHENRLQQGFQERMEHVAQLRQRHIEEYGDRAIIASTDIRGLLPEDVRQRITQRQQAIAEGLANQARYPELLDEKHAKFTEKWMQQKPTVQSPSSVIQAPVQPRTQARPFRSR